MTARLVAAFILGALCAGVPLALLIPAEDSEGQRRFNEFIACDTEVNEVVALCMERIEAADLWSAQGYCRLREAEVLLLRHYPDWPGSFAERDRRLYDAEIDCSGPDMAAAEWTMDELASNRELGVR